MLQELHDAERPGGFRNVQNFIASSQDIRQSRFSRYVVAWMVAERENSALAQQLFAEAISRYGIEPGKLVVHQDRGAPMTAHGFAELLSALGVDRSYSRPRVSNDNPHQESLFHTAKYQPDYPGRFRDARHGRHWCQNFFGWYNHDHHHEGLNLFTPARLLGAHRACRRTPPRGARESLCRSS